MHRGCNPVTAVCRLLPHCCMMVKSGQGMTGEGRVLLVDEGSSVGQLGSTGVGMEADERWHLAAG